MTVPYTIGGIDHVVIRARDIEGMIRFYRDALGCALEKRQDDIGLVQLRAGAGLIDLVDVAGPIGREGGPPPGRDSHNVDHICLYIAPFDGPALTAHLAAHGIAPGEIATRYGAGGYGPSLYLEDPEGNTIELKGPADAGK